MFKLITCAQNSPDLSFFQSMSLQQEAVLTCVCNKISAKGCVHLKDLHFALKAVKVTQIRGHNVEFIKLSASVRKSR